MANLSINYSRKNIKSEDNNNRFRINGLTWSKKLYLPDGPCNIEKIQNNSEYIIKKHETIADNSPVQIYVNEIRSRIVFKVKTGYKLEIMLLLGSSKKVIDKNKDGEIVPRSQAVEVVLVQCNLVNNNDQQESKVFFTFVRNKQFGQLITIAPYSLTMLKTTNAEFSFIEISFTDQNNRQLEIEDKVNIALITGIS